MSSPYAGLTRSSARPIQDGLPTHLISGGGEVRPVQEEEEEHYLTLDLGAVDPSLLANCASIRLVGLETPTPFLQLGDLVFQGIHTRTLGTELVLDADRVIAQSEHKVLFNPVQLIPKAETEPGPESHDPGPPTRPAKGRARGRGKKRAGGST
ncbi:unnamed protein product [Rhizoctonia solani]|uniref:Transcription factor TFIIIC triple barrel domain-containing protein n=1 Tax=Rhizoctonia solani TaxID=456999 RepID=A0A8H3DZI4_9AGAM|nr:unnamed protein product [Rhizoctonia solani]